MTVCQTEEPIDNRVFFHSHQKWHTLQIRQTRLSHNYQIKEKITRWWYCLLQIVSAMTTTLPGRRLAILAAGMDSHTSGGFSKKMSNLGFILFLGGLPISRATTTFGCSRSTSRTVSLSSRWGTPSRLRSSVLLENKHFEMHFLLSRSLLNLETSSTRAQSQWWNSLSTTTPLLMQEEIGTLKRL